MNSQRGTNMACAIEQCDTTRKPILKLRRKFKTFALAISFGALGWPLLTAYPQTVSVVAQQESPRAKAQATYVFRTTASDDDRLPDLSSLDIPSLVRDSDRVGTAMHLQLPEYTYLQTRVSRELDQRGKLVERVSEYDAYPIKVLGHHHHVISLISENGAPISPKRLKKERQQAAKEIEAAERESALQVGDSPAAGAEKYVAAGEGKRQLGGGGRVGGAQILREWPVPDARFRRLAGPHLLAARPTA